MNLLGILYTLLHLHLSINQSLTVNWASVLSHSPLSSPVSDGKSNSNDHQNDDNDKESKGSCWIISTKSLVLCTGPTAVGDSACVCVCIAIYKTSCGNHLQYNIIGWDQCTMLCNCRYCGNNINSNRLVRLKIISTQRDHYNSTLYCDCMEIKTEW